MARRSYDGIVTANDARRVTGGGTWPDSLAAWLAWQDSTHVREIDLGLDRVRSVAGRMGLEKPGYSVVTVAGTNGKGSSVAMLDSIWRNAGYRVAAYTSPHLVDYNERIRIDGVAAADADICAAFERIEASRKGVTLTYFEYGTLAALALFEQARPDIAILEVGLGGRLDAVNIIDPDVSLITALDIDHVAWLGDTRELIAREKAGIMRAGRATVCSDPAVPVSLLECARDTGAILQLLGREFEFDASREAWVWRSAGEAINHLPLPSLVGRHQLRNAAGVLKVVQILLERHPVAHDQIREALVAVRLRGRFQRLGGAIDQIFDVAHNGQAMEVLVETLATQPPCTRTHVLLGMLKTKDHASMMRTLAAVVDSWHLTTLPTSQGATSAELAAVLLQNGSPLDYTCYDTVEDAYEGALRKARSGERVIVTGSFLTVGAVLRILDSAAPAPGAQP